MNWRSPLITTIWSCLTCAQCSVRCPANIDFPEFIRLMRDEAHALGFDGTSRPIMGCFRPSRPSRLRDIKQDRTFWIEDGKTTETGDVFYFVGCRPYFDVVFRDIDAGSIKGAQNVLKIPECLRGGTGGEQ